MKSVHDIDRLLAAGLRGGEKGDLENETGERGHFFNQQQQQEIKKGIEEEKESTLKCARLGSING